MRGALLWKGRASSAYEDCRQWELFSGRVDTLTFSCLLQYKVHEDRGMSVLFSTASVTPPTVPAACSVNS